MAVEGVIDSSYKLGPGDYLDIMLEQDFSSKFYLMDLLRLKSVE